MDSLRQKRSRLAECFLWVVLAPAAAQAHNSLPGMGEFANGFAHPLATPPHLLLLICLGLLLGQRRPLSLKLPLAVFIPVSAVGLFMTTTGIWKVEPPAILASVSLVIGFLVVTALPTPGWAVALIFAAGAMALGLDSVADAAVTPWAVAKTLFGTWISFMVWIVDIGFYIFILPSKKWLQTGVRVAGSWIVAISFLVLAFALKG